MEWLEWAKALAPLVTLLLSALLLVIGFLGRQVIKGFGDQLAAMQKQFGEQIKALQEKHSDLEKEFLKFQIQLPRIFTLKDDHIRHVTLLEKAIAEMRADVNESLASLNRDVKQLLSERGTQS